jgi:hypothetical protein
MQAGTEDVLRGLGIEVMVTTNLIILTLPPNMSQQKIWAAATITERGLTKDEIGSGPTYSRTERGLTITYRRGVPVTAPHIE